MTILELITKLYTLSADSVDMAARAAAESGIAGAKDVYMAWGKEKGILNKALEQEWKLAQPEKAKSGAKGFAEYYYDWLAESTRTEQEAIELIMSNESKNVQSHLTHYLNIWALAETVRKGSKVYRTVKGTSAKRESAAAPDEWEYDAAKPYVDIRSAWETLKREQLKSKPSKLKVHPDKVSFLGDDELTAAYTKAFQVYSKGR